MAKWLSIVLHFLVSLFQTRRDLAFENLLLRQQLAVLEDRSGQPRLAQADRSFWVLVSKLWPKWRDALHIVKPKTVIRWHREGFRCHWTRKCRKKGRPELDPKIRLLIQRVSQANPLWGAPRIHGELLKLGVEVSETIGSKYLTRIITTRFARTFRWRKIRRGDGSFNSRIEVQSDHADIALGCIMNTTGESLRMNKREGHAKVFDGEEVLIGQSVLERLLVELRELLKNDTDESLKTVLPLDIPDFLLLGRPIETVVPYQFSLTSLPLYGRYVVPHLI